VSALIDDWVPDRLAYRARNAADHNVDLVFVDELPDVADGNLRIEGGVRGEKLDRLPANAAGGVDLLNR
jgi:hypothetical protein